jgi:prepilin-type N-terminal cleavage/methylation domain-containing protein
MKLIHLLSSRPAVLRKFRIEHKEAGFSIVELLVAIVVGGLFVLSVNTAITNYTYLGQQSKDLILANSFAEGKVEELRNIGYNGLTVGTTDLSSQLPTALNGPRSASLHITNPITGIKQVDISISYTQRGQKSYSYTTYIGELGVGQ